ncbi:MAG: trypsin-like serine protease [Catenulispora sp.]|nr:trypsin-like serine protease [Catenulispora sp.]
MLGTALSTSHSSARALTADGSTPAGPATSSVSGSTAGTASSAATSSTSEAAVESPSVATTSASADTKAPDSATPVPSVAHPAANPASSGPAGAGAGPVSTVDSSAPQTGPPAGRPFGGTPAVGVLFLAGSGVANHFCSASVVHSTAGNLVITAGHCVYSDGPKQNVAFAPGYHDGQTPYGTWTVTRIVVSDGWRGSHNEAEDVAFLQVAPSGSGASLESVTGADQIGFNRGFGMPVTVPAYPLGSDTPITCVAPAVKYSATQTEWDCRGYPDGTSGAPFLTDVDAGGAKGTVIGVIGGYQQGGDTPDVSYSAYFGNAVQALYQTAAAQ